MERTKRWSMVSLVFAASVAFVVSLTGLLGLSVASAQAMERADESLVDPLAPQQAPAVLMTVHFTDPGIVNVYGIDGVLIDSNAVHGGDVQCDTACSQSTHLSVAGAEFSYFFQTPVTVDTSEGHAVVEGEGHLMVNGKVKDFTFTATFQDNKDETLSVLYETSLKKGSLKIPVAEGYMAFDTGPVID